MKLGPRQQLLSHIHTKSFWHSQKSVIMVLTSVYALLQYMQNTQAGLADTVPYNALLSDEMVGLV